MNNLRVRFQASAGVTTLRRGRPPLHPESCKRSSFTTRIRPELKATLVGQAKTHGRSLSEEIEERLERSLRDDEVLVRLDEILSLVETGVFVSEQWHKSRQRP